MCVFSEDNVHHGLSQLQPWPKTANRASHVTIDSTVIVQTVLPVCPNTEGLDKIIFSALVIL
jgi:hypothetical protein